jgi:hypothetical protein
MERNVYTWHIAIEEGLNPGDYSYDPELVPLGEFEAILDFKIWSKKVMGINCYFTQRNSDIKFQLTVYRQLGTKEYVIKEGGIDFTISPVGCLYHLNVEENLKGRVVFQDAIIVTEIENSDLNFSG